MVQKNTGVLTFCWICLLIRAHICRWSTLHLFPPAVLLELHQNTRRLENVSHPEHQQTPQVVFTWSSVPDQVLMKSSSVWTNLKDKRSQRWSLQSNAETVSVFSFIRNVLFAHWVLSEGGGAWTKANEYDGNKRIRVVKQQRRVVPVVFHSALIDSDFSRLQLCTHMLRLSLPLGFYFEGLMKRRDFKVSRFLLSRRQTAAPWQSLEFNLRL